MARVVAWYLPQYHPIPENDAWWGRGFTDWANVAKARPRFPGHRQPQLPSELGFYDLRLPEVRAAQADLARAHGIAAFCYYHYWFGGRQLLERPFAEVLASRAPDFPFCLCWANENWTRAWDGLEQDVLLAQRYGEDDDRRHVRWLATAFRDPRYLRVDGRPLFLVYRVSALPDPRRTAAVWREEARRLGVDDPFLCTVESLRYDRVDPAAIGFDAAVDFQPDWLALGEPDRRLANDTLVFDYGTVVDRMRARPEPSYRRFGGVMTGWDNSARRERNAVIVHGATPERYERWLRDVIARADASGPDTPVFVNAWNEWAEGAHLEPCTRFGRAFLEATRAALAPPAAAPRSAPVDAVSSMPAEETAAEPARAPRVSVAIPTYQGARFLGAAIASVLAQTLDDFELLVVDDCSTDETEAVVRSFADRRVTYRRNPARLGLAANWNRCLALARAPYVTVFHQDDVMHAENLARKVAFLDAHPSAGMVHSSVRQIGPNGELLSSWWYREPRPEDEGLRPGRDWFFTLLRGVNEVCCPSVLWRRAWYARLGGFDERLPFTADWEMWMRLALAADVGYLATALVDYRRHDGNETEKFLGVRELEHGLLAKRLVLEKCADRIDDVAALRAEVVGRHRERALAEAARRYRGGDVAGARPFLVFAASLRTDDLADDGDTWLVELVDGLVGSGALRRGGDGMAGAVRGTALHAEALRAAYPRDLAEHVGFRRLAKAVLVKISNAPGGRWLRSFEGLVARLFR